MSEVWKPVAEDSRYSVSDQGRVRGAFGRLLKPRKHTNGYVRVSLGSGRDRYVHRLVCNAFHGPPPSGNHVDHINHDRGDNRASNLRWVTPEENRARRLHRKGAEHANSKLTAPDVRAIRDANDPTQDKHLAAQFGVSREAVRDVRLGKCWSHIQ